MNNRLAGPRQAAAVYDSSLDFEIGNPMSTLGTTNYDFDKMLRREQLKTPDIYHTNEIVNPSSHTFTGEKVTLKQRVDSSPMKSYVKERRSNNFEHLLNKTAETYRTARKIDTTISVKRLAPADKTIAARVQKSEVPGVQFGASVTERPPLSTAPTDLGPGEYDVTAWESGKCGISKRCLKFDGVGAGSRFELEYRDEPSATTYFRNDEGMPRPSTTGSISFNETKRFPNTDPEYAKGTGLLLGHEFDEKDAWRAKADYGLGKQSHPRCDTAPATSDIGVDFVNTDAGKKITFKTEVARSKYKYAPCFKSKSVVGLAIPTPPSGDIGPDHYRGVFKSSLKCVDPDNKSSSFASKRHMDIVQLGKQYETLKPRFGKIMSNVEHTRAQTLNATYGEKELKSGLYTTFGRGRKGRLVKSKFTEKMEYDYTPEVKLSHIAEFSKTKISKIYPRLAKEKFG